MSRSSHYGNQYGGAAKKLRIELPQDPTISLLGIDLKVLETLIHRDICTLVFSAVLFMMAETWKQLKFLLPQRTG